MAARNWNRVQALEKETKHLYGKVTIGASGAPTLVQSLGFASVVRNSAGNYTVTLQDKYVALMSVKVSYIAAVAEDLSFQVSAEAVKTAKTIGLLTLTGGVATDPASGDILLIEVVLKNSSTLEGRR